MSTERSTVDASDPRVMQAILNEEAMYALAAMQVAAEPLPAHEIAVRADIPPERIHAALDALEAAELVEKLKAGGGRKSIEYRALVQEVRVITPPSEEGNAIYATLQATLARFQEGELRRMQLPSERETDDWHFGYCIVVRMTRSDREELKRRMLALMELLRDLRERSDRLPPDEEITKPYVLFARGAPLKGRVRPTPRLQFTTSKFEDDLRGKRIDPPEMLGAREREVARLLHSGLTRAEIASRLAISVDTVGSHCKRIFRKLGIRRATELSKFVLDEPGPAPRSVRKPARAGAPAPAPTPDPTPPFSAAPAPSASREGA